MPVPSTIDELSLTAGSNYPAGSESPNVLDDTQRAHASFIAKLRDEKANVSDLNDKLSKTATGAQQMIGQLHLNKQNSAAGDSRMGIRLNQNSAAGGGYLGGDYGEVEYTHNCEYITGTGWVARGSSASLIVQSDGVITFCCNTGLTVGAAFTPTEVFRQSSSGALTVTGNILGANIGAAGTYGGMSIFGAAGGYNGFQFGNSNIYVMSDGANAGIYKVGVGWLCRFDPTGIMLSGSVPFARVTGAPIGFDSNATYNNVTASRSAYVEYPNNTGKLMFVQLRSQAPSGAQAELQIKKAGSSTWETVSNHGGDYNNGATNMAFVRPGDSYKYLGAYIGGWYEFY